MEITIERYEHGNRKFWELIYPYDTTSFWATQWTLRCWGPMGLRKGSKLDRRVATDFDDLLLDKLRNGYTHAGKTTIHVDPVMVERALNQDNAQMLAGLVYAAAKRTEATWSDVAKQDWNELVGQGWIPAQKGILDVFDA
jgi:hypothetical protein